MSRRHAEPMRALPAEYAHSYDRASGSLMPADPLSPATLVTRGDPAELRCRACGGPRVIPMTWGYRQTGFEQAGFKCADCGRRLLTMEGQRTPRAI